MVKAWLKRQFTDKNGKVVVGQWPNIWIWLWLASILASRLSEGGVKTVFDSLGFGSLFIWAYLELVSGVNNFRKTLGAAVLLFLVISKLQ